MGNTKFDRDSMIELLKEVSQSDRMVIEFQKRGGEIRAMDITDHVEILERKVEDDDDE